jgi:hypothetical protein
LFDKPVSKIRSTFLETIGNGKTMKGKKIQKSWKVVIQGLPLAAAAGANFLPLRALGQQFLMLITLVWIQVFFIIECFLKDQ